MCHCSVSSVDTFANFGIEQLHLNRRLIAFPETSSGIDHLVASVGTQIAYWFINNHCSQSSGTS